MNFSPTAEIINHFDELTHKVDIDAEESIKKFNGELDLGKLSTNKDRYTTTHWKEKGNTFLLDFHEEYYDEYRRDDSRRWNESTKIIDYMAHVRMETIELLRKEQGESLNKYKLLSSRSKDELKHATDKEELKSKMFDDKFYFPVRFKQPNPSLWAFNLYIFVTDFYMSASEINLLE